ncbi:hypothetical protein E2562_010994 [Oryza meyeriana var. granulata]|uniref:Uncharacterized protein n=1 Tax=Oryza meyeriana var. granulata TaxID=110450 RepID=A0A6G1BWS1_9ORYZ|nr:hypothetical protein E2562_010994 [Oryza meyeriana var. granulata]
MPLHAPCAAAAQPTSTVEPPGPFRRDVIRTRGEQPDLPPTSRAVSSSSTAPTGGDDGFPRDDVIRGLEAFLLLLAATSARGESRRPLLPFLPYAPAS